MGDIKKMGSAKFRDQGKHFEEHHLYNPSSQHSFTENK